MLGQLGGHLERNKVGPIPYIREQNKFQMDKKFKYKKLNHKVIEKLGWFFCDFESEGTKNKTETSKTMWEIWFHQQKSQKPENAEKKEIKEDNGIGIMIKEHYKHIWLKSLGNEFKQKDLNKQHIPVTVKK